MSTKNEKLVVMKPEDRLKLLTNASNAVEVDPHIPPRRYYRSGIEMVRMANVYYEEGNIENAYVLYMKYMTLFLEKIRTHPDFNQVPVNMKHTHQMKLREILPKAEKLKKELLEQYTKEFETYKTIKKKEEEEAKKVKEQVSSHYTWQDVTVLPPSNIKDISYPNLVDTPSAPPAPAKKPPKPKSPGPTPTPVVSVPSIDRSVKPTIYDSSTEGGLRTVIIPASLMPQFLMLAGHNTMRNRETCGILAGILEHNHLIITHMIVPKQKGTADSCVTMNEEEIFDFQDLHNLITIGWIHTHPTQTAFLSSVDLHTHCPYQLLMPEAIAIVCAPKYNDTGIFVLTPNFGLNYISNCRSTGFHPHPTDPPLFMTASHIKIESSLSLEVYDLRT